MTLWHDLIDKSMGSNTSHPTSKMLIENCHQGARCAFFDRNLHSRMPLDPTHVRLKLLHASDQCHSSRVSTALTVSIINPVDKLKGEPPNSTWCPFDLWRTTGDVCVARAAPWKPSPKTPRPLDLRSCTRLICGAPQAMYGLTGLLQRSCQ
jgi:hypothetical protein